MLGMDEFRGLSRRGFVAGFVGLALAVPMAGVLAGCGSDGGASQGLPSWADKDEVTQLARDVIDEYNASDFDAIVARWFMDSELTTDQLKQGADQIASKLGAFESFADVAYLGGSNNGVDFATVIQVAQYANGKAQFTVSFTKDDKLCGFYVK